MNHFNSGNDVAHVGVVEEREAAAKKFYRVHALTDLTTSEEAMSHAAAWLERLAARAAEQLDSQLSRSRRRAKGAD